MKSMKITGIAAVAAMVCSGAAVANPDRPDWSFVEIAYNQGNSGSGENNDAIRGGVSISGWDYVHLQLDYEDGEVGNERLGVGNTGESTDFDSYTVTLGVHPSIGNETDLHFDIFTGQIDPDEVSGSNIDYDEADFWGLTGGFRHMITQRFEVNGSVNYQDTDSYGDPNGPNPGDTSGSIDSVFAKVGGQFNWNNFSGGLTYTFDDPLRDDLVELNFRWSWGDWF
jgi:hypothetical protein